MQKSKNSTTKLHYILIDFEGYNGKNNFIFKEFAINFIETNIIHNFFLKTKKFNDKNYYWLMKHHHRIPHYYGQTPYKYIKQFIFDISDFVFIVKGEAKKKYLEKITKNQIINLEDYGCPKYSELTSNVQNNCTFHSHTPSEHCSILKLDKLHTWLHTNNFTKIKNEFEK